MLLKLASCPPLNRHFIGPRLVLACSVCHALARRARQILYDGCILQRHSCICTVALLDSGHRARRRSRAHILCERMVRSITGASPTVCCTSTGECRSSNRLPTPQPAASPMPPHGPLCCPPLAQRPAPPRSTTTTRLAPRRMPATPYTPPPGCAAEATTTPYPISPGYILHSRHNL